MRVSSNMLFDSNVAAMNQQQARLMQTQQQISTGRKILTASDDPVAAARALDVTQSDAMNTQYAANRGAARHTLSLAESTLQGVTLLLQDVKTATVNAGNGTMNASDRRTMATDLSGRLQELTGLANSTDGVGNFLFAGFQSKTTPFVSTAAGMAYFGDDGQRNVQVSATRQMPSSGNGADLFMRIKNGNGTFVAQAAAANTGNGIIGSGAISNPALLTGDSYTITYNGPASANGANAGTGVISTPTVVTPVSVTGLDYQIAFNDIATQKAAGSSLGSSIASPATVVTPASVTGHNYSITADGAGGYTVQDLTLGAPVVAPTINPGSPDTVDFDGIQVAITGAALNDTFNVLASTYNVTALPAGSNTQVITSLDFTVPGNIVTPASTAVPGVFTDFNLGAGETYSMSIASSSGTVNLLTQTNGVVTTADITQALTANAGALAAAGITVSGSAAGGDLAFSDAMGRQLTTNVLNQSGAGGFASAPLGTGGATTLQTATTANGVQANSASFVVDAAGNNTTVTLTGVYANEAALVAKMQADLDAGAGGVGAYTVTSQGTVAAANFSVTIERVSAGAASAPVTVSAPDAGALAKGIAISAGTAGGASVATNQAYVSGQPINFGGLQVNIQGIPNPGDSFVVSSPGYTVTNNTTLATIPATGRTLYVAGQQTNFDIDGIRIDIQGAPAVGDTFTVSPSINESVFKTLADLITALNAPVVGASLTNSLNHGLAQLDTALNNVLTTRSSLGLRLNEVDALQTAGDDLGLQFKQTLSELQDVDYNQAISDLVRQQTNLQAAQQTFSKVAGLSLFDYI